MKMLAVSASVSLLAIGVCAGCAMDRSSTRAMGASPAASEQRTLYCKDGAYATKSVGCIAGVERELTPAGSAVQK